MRKASGRMIPRDEERSHLGKPAWWWEWTMQWCMQLARESIACVVCSIYMPGPPTLFPHTHSLSLSLSSLVSELRATRSFSRASNPGGKGSLFIPSPDLRRFIRKILCALSLSRCMEWMVDLSQSAIITSIYVCEDIHFSAGVKMINHCE
jgi:hypothetical protein